MFWFHRIEQITADGGQDWLLANVESRGYYRVNYDDTNWAMLHTQLLNDHNVSIIFRFFFSPNAFQYIGLFVTN